MSLESGLTFAFLECHRIHTTSIFTPKKHDFIWTLEGDWETPLEKSTESFVLLSSVNRNHANPMENVPWLGCHISPNHLHRNFGSPTLRSFEVLENHNSYCISRMFLRFCHLTKGPVFSHVDSELLELKYFQQ